MNRLSLATVVVVSLFGVAIRGRVRADDNPRPGAAAEEPIPRVAPVEPTEALKTFKTLDGFQMELLAAEPLVTDPVAGVYDEDGRLYVVEMTDYPYADKKNDKANTENTLDPPIGRVRLLIDRDGDGRFDESHIFADKLSWPTGITLWKGGVFVAATPDIWYLKDTDGDHKADVRTPAYTGFRKYNVQAVMNNLQWGLDHKVYGAGAGNGGVVRPGDQPSAKPVSVLRRDFRIDPATGAFEAISGGARFGNTFDDWGNRFLCDIRNPAEHVVLPSHYLERNPYLPTPRVLHDAALAGDALPVFRISPPEPWREVRARRWAAIGKAYPRSELVGAGYVTSSSGITVYRGNAYPARYLGNLFLGEVAGNLIHRETLEPDGVTFRARRADPEIEFVASTDIWFRPVNFINAPDGTLHVLDMYRETIEHPWSIPDDIKAQLDLRNGSDRGRIYRLAPPSFRPPPPPKLGQATTEALVGLLESANGWHRDTAHRLLYERHDPAAVAPLKRMLRESRQPLARLHALWSLDGLDQLADDDLQIALTDQAPGVREHAAKLAEPRLSRSPALFERLIALASDPNARVRFQVAFTLGESDNVRAVDGLSAIARRDAADVWVRTAVLSSSTRFAPRLFASLLDDPAFVARREAIELLRSLAQVVGARNNAGEAAQILTSLSGSRLAQHDLDAVLEVALGLGDGLARAGKRLNDVRAGAPDSVGTLLDPLFARAVRAAPDTNAPPEARERAIALLAHFGASQAKELLPRLLDPREPQRVQLAAVRALASFADPEVAPLLLRRWTGYTPALRSEVIQLLLSRSIWIESLLDAVEAKTVAAGQIPANRRTLLLENRDLAVRAKARTLFGSGPPGPRAEVVARYQPALTLPSDRNRGVKVFERECMSCHRLGDKGYAVGPNLSSVQRRTSEEVLMHILDPNREVGPDYVEYAVALNDGRVVTGLIATETATSVTLRRALGAEETVLRQNINEITSTGKSLMPEGLEKQISPQEMSDLLAFVLELQRP
jgi:putative membrane-bound dehydrogenase-like protein